jgi:hypothetical protein
MQNWYFCLSERLSDLKLFIFVNTIIVLALSKYYETFLQEHMGFVELSITVWLSECSI